VQAVHDSCPGVYGYSYDDGMGLVRCSSDTTYEVTFYCPSSSPLSRPPAKEDDFVFLMKKYLEPRNSTPAKDDIARRSAPAALALGVAASAAMVAAIVLRWDRRRPAAYSAVPQEPAPAASSGAGCDFPGLLDSSC